METLKKQTKPAFQRFYEVHYSMLSAGSLLFSHFIPIFFSVDIWKSTENKYIKKDKTVIEKKKKKNLCIKFYFQFQTAADNNGFYSWDGI